LEQFDHTYGIINVMFETGAVGHLIWYYTASKTTNILWVISHIYCFRTLWKSGNIVPICRYFSIIIHILRGYVWKVISGLTISGNQDCEYDTIAKSRFKLVSTTVETIWVQWTRQFRVIDSSGSPSHKHFCFSRMTKYTNILTIQSVSQIY